MSGFVLSLTGYALAAFLILLYVTSGAVYVVTSFIRGLLM